MAKNMITGNANNTAQYAVLRWIKLKTPSTLNILGVRILCYTKGSTAADLMVAISELQVLKDSTNITNNGSTPYGVASSTSMHSATYAAANVLEGTITAAYAYNWWSANGVAPTLTAPQGVMIKFPVKVNMNAVRFYSADNNSNRGTMKDFEVQFTTDDTAVVTDPKESTKWFGVDLIQDSTEFAATTDGGTTPCTLATGYTPNTLKSYKFLVQLSNGDLYNYDTSWTKIGTGAPTDSNFNIANPSAYTIQQLNELITLTNDTQLTIIAAEQTGTTYIAPTASLKVTQIPPQTVAPTGTVSMTAIPFDQFVHANDDIELFLYSYIDFIRVNDGVTTNETGAGALRFLASRDSGLTYYAFNSTEWVKIVDTATDGTTVNGRFIPDSTTMARIMSQGMTKAQFNVATWQAWLIDAGYTKVRFGYGLSQQASTDIAFNDSVKAQCDGQGKWRICQNGVDYTIYLSNTAIDVKWLTPLNGKRVKINY